jgi:hypothetical protein
MNPGTWRYITSAAVIFVVSLVLSLPALAASKQTLTGEVSDAMCGRKHMEGAAADCTRSCVKGGSKYSLVVGDKIYMLETTDKSALATLDQQAGKKATVTGTVNGDATMGYTVAVSTVAAAK